MFRWEPFFAFLFLFFPPPRYQSQPGNMGVACHPSLLFRRDTHPLLASPQPRELLFFVFFWAGAPFSFCGRMRSLVDDGWASLSNPSFLLLSPVQYFWVTISAPTNFTVLAGTISAGHAGFSGHIGVNGGVNRVTPRWATSPCRDLAGESLLGGADDREIASLIHPPIPRLIQHPKLGSTPVVLGVRVCVCVQPIQDCHIGSVFDQNNKKLKINPRPSCVAVVYLTISPSFPFFCARPSTIHTDF